MKRAVCGSAIALVFGAVTGWADRPGMIHYQGRLVLGTNLYSGPVSAVFRLYDAATGGTLLHTSTNFATAVDGLYATVIGEHGVIGNLDAALTNAQVWLEVQVNGTTLSPRERLLAVPYAQAVRGMRVVDANNIILNAEAGANRIVQSIHSTIAGGALNDIGTNSSYSAIGGGSNNSVAANSRLATIGGGAGNNIGTDSFGSTIGGGYNNTVSNGSDTATIAGGAFNKIGTISHYSAIGGGYTHTVADNSWFAAIAGGSGNSIGTYTYYSTIGGGFNNTVSDSSDSATIDGGYRNGIGINSDYSAIGGGFQNNIAGDSVETTIAGGSFNDIGTNSPASAIGGGENNNIGANSSHATIAGGLFNDIAINSDYTTVGGGYDNNVANDAHYSAIPGGRENAIGANATYALAAGRRAKANHRGAFVWGDDTAADVVSTNNNQVTFRASGGYRIFSSPTLLLGVALNPNATAWSAISDRNAKENIVPIDPQGVLDGVRQLPLSSWNYKADPGHRRYIGPMAQDFHAQFGLGDERTINTLDADGVLFAAVQALAAENDRLKEANKRQEIEFQQQTELLRSRIEALEKALLQYQK